MEGFDRSLAFIIAIDNYSNGVPRLRTPVADAKALAKCLREDHGFETELILNSAATLGGLRTFLSGLPDRVGGGDRVLFYFAGHGIATPSDTGPTGYILPQDADQNTSANYLPMLELDTALSALPCRHMLVILDCCFAGAFQWASTRYLALSPEHLHQERYRWFIEDPAWQAIASAAHDQKALDIAAEQPLGKRGSTQNHSPFASALVAGLKGLADRAAAGQMGDGVITATELYQHLDEALRPQGAGAFRQTPTFWPLKKHDKGQFVFLVPGRELDLPPAPVLDEDANPWRGLEPYEPRHAELFFGRGEVSKRLLHRVLDESFIVVTGPSGIGKSSLVRAGLLPRLADDSFEPIVVRPGPTPFASLARALAAATPPGSIAPDE
ncbi:caspase family protein, partial [Mesorhizobium sp. M0663]|uniref:nSTAND1 domain-containing NTPase n=1 Tax=Mesorhizobium sp. M0663 TaxID=2956981 RepID=UPI003334E154